MTFREFFNLFGKKQNQAPTPAPAAPAPVQPQAERQRPGVPSWPELEDRFFKALQARNNREKQLVVLLMNKHYPDWWREFKAERYQSLVSRRS